MIKIETQNVWLSYGRKTVLKDVTFQVTPGEMVSHIISPYSGKMLLDGKEVAKIPRRDLARLIGVVPQMPLLPSAFTAFEIVLMGRNPHLGLFQYEGPREMSIAWQAMERTGTQSLAQRRINELSGGEIQCLLTLPVFWRRKQRRFCWMSQRQIWISVVRWKSLT